jgi:hypothetical protein
MKKLAIRLIFTVALMIIPMSVFAMSSIDDNSMDNVTGQAGVSITIDEAIDMNVKIESLAFKGSDAGFTMDMVDTSANGMHINIKQDDASKPMTLAVNTVNSDTVITVGLPAATVVVENIPDIKIGVSDGGSTDTLGTLSVGKTTLKMNSGKVSMKML